MSGYVYILTNAHHTVLYTGVTSDLARRVSDHKSGVVKGFTHRYNVHKLVYVEQFEDVVAAITREKQIKAGPRRRKLELIGAANSEWRDLAADL